MFITQLFEAPVLYVSIVVAFAASICIHEYSHAFVAHHLGDDTAKNGGYMTLNPLKVMGWLSILALLLFGFSWGAVPVKRNMPSRWRKSVISLVGPLSNLALLGFFALLLKWMCVFAPGSAYSRFVFYGRPFLICAIYANSILFLLNILPIPPLDGWGTIEPFLANSLIPSEKTKRTIFTIFVYLICFSTATSGFFDNAVAFLTEQFLPSQWNSIAALNEGNVFFEAGDYENAFKAYEIAAEQGNSEGYLNLACCLAKGYGCTADSEKAFALLSREDVCEFRMAKYFLGMMQMHGEGCTQDYSKAYALLSQQDVQEAFPDARAKLGMLLTEGWGVEQNIPKAFSILNDDEVMNVSPEARYYMAVFLMEGKVCEKDEARAFALMNDPDVLSVFPSAKFMLGLWYWSGSGIPQNFEEAARLLKEAADEGEPNAVQLLGYQNGEMPDYDMPLETILEIQWNENN